MATQSLKTIIEKKSGASRAEEGNLSSQLLGSQNDMATIRLIKQINELYNEGAEIVRVSIFDNEDSRH